MHEYSKVFLRELWLTMNRIRLCEEYLVDPINRGEIRCPVHLYSGEEAIAVGTCFALTREDYIFGNHRSHGHYIAKGGNIKQLIAECYGKEEGCSRGRGGSMHLIDTEVGMLGTAPIVGGTISLALGAALASKIRREERVSVSFFGDGATGEGVLFESLNFAALRKLPMIFICENNLYSTHMPIRECRPNCEIYRIAEPFDIMSKKIDGNNVLEVYETVQESVEMCRNGDGPVFIECETYRFRGHVGPDDKIQGMHTDIRPDEEVKYWKNRDPIKIFETFLLKNAAFNHKELQDMMVQVKREVNEAFEFAQNGSLPMENELSKYVFK